MFDVNMIVDAEGVMIDLRLDVTLMEQIIELVKAREEYTVASFDDVHMRRNFDGTWTVHISVHKHGETEYTLDEFGLIDWDIVRARPPVRTDV